MKNIKAIIFDAYGTLFDVNSAAEKCKDKIGDKWEGFANYWRTTQLEYTWLRSLMKRHKDFWQVTEDSLDKSMKILLKFEELNINDTWFEDDRNDRRIHQYFRNGKDAYNINPSLDYFGGGGLISTAKDLSKFFYLLFNNKVFNEESTLEEMLKKYKYQTPAMMDYSLGIWEIELDDVSFYTHSGFWGTQVVYSPKYDISFSVNYSKGWVGSPNAPLIKQVFSLIVN